MNCVYNLTTREVKEVENAHLFLVPPWKATRATNRIWAPASHREDLAKPLYLAIMQDL